MNYLSDNNNNSSSSRTRRRTRRKRKNNTSLLSTTVAITAVNKAVQVNYNRKLNKINEYLLCKNSNNNNGDQNKIKNENINFI